ncbi:MAG: ATP-binding protein [Crocinitomicaceae bacterium]
MALIGRRREKAIMESLLQDDKAHMLALIGRRRVGKTFLIRTTYREHIVFEMTGLKDAPLDQQLLNFTFQFNQFFPKMNPLTGLTEWLTAFQKLTEQIQQLAPTIKPVLFFDELPWIAGKRSGFIEALAHWWNNWASQQNILLVVCGSAAAWMIDHIVNAKGGLHNRITKLITLQPFTLSETKEFLQSREIKMSNYQIVQLYMTLGGIPHYLEQLQKGKSAVQNIQEICFNRNGALNSEFDNLYSALFDNAQNHIAVIKALASKSKGLDRKEILSKTNIKDGGWFSSLLTELETSGFITSLRPLEKKKKDTLFRLTDEFTLFYLTFMQGKRNTDSNYWIGMSQTQEYKIWCGYAFENVCAKHISSLKKALGIGGIQAEVSSFLHRKNDKYHKGFQVDLLIDRKDDVLTICEMKFYSDEYKITSDYAKKIHTRREGMKALNSPKKHVEVVFISTFGVVDNEQRSDYVDHDLKMDVLFNH